MSPPREVASIVLVLVAAVSMGCRSTAPPAMPLARNPCDGLSNVFYLVAYERDRGTSRESQVSRLAETVESPFVASPGRTHAELSRVVDYVYRNRRASPDDLRSRVRAACTVDSAGQARLSLARQRR